VTAVVNGVVIRVIAPDEQGGHADIDVIEQGLRHGLRRSDQGGGIPGGADLRKGVLDLVIAAVIAERSRGRPGLLHDVEVLVGTVVALVLGQVVAVAALLAVAAPGD
jgi:hypothetical protein